MKPVYQLIFCLIIFLSGCDTYNFSRPLPIDRDNLKKFPRELRGTWESTKDTAHYFIGENDFCLFSKEISKILKGVWPKRDDTGAIILSTLDYQGVYKPNYDSINKRWDSLPAYVFGKNLIYQIGSDDYLLNGYPYSVVADTITIYANDSVFVHLPTQAVLRRLDSKLFALSIKSRMFAYNSHTSLDEGSSWWMVVIIQVIDDQTMRLMVPGEKMQKKRTMFYHKDSDYYFDSDWTSAEMQSLIKDSCFDIGILKRVP